MSQSIEVQSVREELWLKKWCNGSTRLTMMTRGEVSDESRAYADKRLGSLIEHIAEPVLFAR